MSDIKRKIALIGIALMLMLSSAVLPTGYEVKAANQDLRIGVTAPDYDDVGAVLRNIGAGISYSTLTRDDMNSLDRLSQFHAVFINCGSHDIVNASILRSYVNQGGVVYASDLAAYAIHEAFSGVFSFSDYSYSQTVSNAVIEHTSLASHMGRRSLDIVFNLDGWAVITELSPAATVYIRGNVAEFGESPLAFSFSHGNGNVFYTSFHNHVQATSDMVNFIEYLVFRIQHIEAERTLRNIAEAAGYDFDGSVFGVLDVNETSEPFFYTPQANDYMLLFDPSMGDFTILLNDPTGNVFSTEQTGILTDVDVSPEDFHLAFYGFPVELITTDMVVEGLGKQGFRVLNPIAGEWSFTVRSNNPEPNSMFAVGLAERPTAALTRAMFVQVLANFDGQEGLSGYTSVLPSFNDTPVTEWYFRAVEWAARNDIVAGVGDNRFAPNSPISRQQMLTMLFRYARFMEVELPGIRTITFTDQDDIAGWALNGVMAMYEADVIDARPDGSIQPRLTATTTEVADLFTRFLSIIEAQMPTDPLPPDPSVSPTPTVDPTVSPTPTVDPTSSPDPQDNGNGNGDDGFFAMLLDNPLYLIIGGAVLLLIIVGIILFVNRKKIFKSKGAAIPPQGAPYPVESGPYETMPQNRCPQCGSALNENAAFCGTCGYQIVSQPVDQPYSQPPEQPYSQPSVQQYGQPLDQPYGQQADQPYAQPASQTYGQSSEQTYAQPTNQTYGQPSEQTYAQPASQSYGQPSEQTYAQPANQTYGQPSEQAYAQPANQTYGQPYSQPSEQPYNQQANQPYGQYPTGAIVENRCTQCGSILKENAVFCGSCGHKVGT